MQTALKIATGILAVPIEAILGKKSRMNVGLQPNDNHLSVAKATIYNPTFPRAWLLSLAK